MLRLNVLCARSDRLKHELDARSCLTLLLARSDNGSILQSCRRKSFCRLQLDAFFGAMFWSSDIQTAPVEAWCSGARLSRVADWARSPVIAGLRLPWNFRVRKWLPRHCCFAPAVCFGSLTLSVLRMQFVAEVRMTETMSRVVLMRSSASIFRGMRLRPAEHPGRVPADLVA